MAINNWRYVVTWWYMDPNGNIIEEKKWVPATSVVTPTIKTATSQTTPPAFSNADAFRFQSQWYADQGDTPMASAFWGLASDLGKYQSFANTSIDTADALLNYIRWNEMTRQFINYMKS